MLPEAFGLYSPNPLSVPWPGDNSLVLTLKPHVVPSKVSASPQISNTKHTFSLFLLVSHHFSQDNRKRPVTWFVFRTNGLRFWVRIYLEIAEKVS